MTREAGGRWLDFTTRMVAETADQFEFDISVAVRRDGRVTERQKLVAAGASRGSEYDRQRGRVYRHVFPSLTWQLIFTWYCSESSEWQRRGRRGE